MTPASLCINFNDEEFKDVRLSRSLPKLSVFFFTHLCKLGLQTNRNGIEICNTVINTKFVMQIFVKFDYCTSLTVKLTQGQMSNQAISGVHEQAATKKTKQAHNALNLRHVLHSMIHCIDKILLCSTTNFEATNVNYEILHFSFFKLIPL